MGSLFGQASQRCPVEGCPPSSGLCSPRSPVEAFLISFGCVESRLFGGWAMHAIGIFDFKPDLVNQLIEQYGEEAGSVRFPVEDWKVLALISDLRVG